MPQVTLEQNSDGNLIQPGTYTDNTSSAPQYNSGSGGIAFFLNVTGHPGGVETLTLNLLWKGPTSGINYVIDQSPVFAAATDAFVWQPTVPLPRAWVLSVVHSTSGPSWTYSVDHSLQMLPRGLGSIADAAATSDTGRFSPLALFKRLLQKFSTQFPAALVGGRLDVNVGATAVTQPVSGTVTANAGTGTFTVDQADTASLDYDTGGGTVNQAVLGLALPAVGGPVAGGTAGNPVRTDPTGTTPQPVTLPALPAGTNNIGDVDIASFAAGALAEVQGDVAHDAPAAGNPVLLGGIAATAADAAVANQVSADADLARLLCDRDGALFSHPHGPRIWSYSNQSSAAQTDTTVKAAVASLCHHITEIYVAANGVVTLTVEEGTTTFKWRYYAAAAGDGAMCKFRVPLKLTANTSVTYTTSGAVEHTLVVTGYTAP